MTRATALLVIDLQEAMRAEREAGYPWANPEAPATAGRLLAAFRAANLVVVHIHHHGTDPEDGFHPDNPLSRAMAEVAPQPGEAVVIKHGSSGFIGTGLDGLLRDAGCDHLVVVGGEANMCVESTTRMGGNMGFRMTVVADALVNFQRTRRDGVVISPRDVLEMSLANLTSFARVADCADVLAELGM
ncbi:MAG: isochorismatase family protein [Candidatus Saccharibacteria bacterium]|nr:isochorismatase family protein [Pseudorhodobacter sp.]